MKELTIEFILTVEEETGYTLSSYENDSASFDNPFTSFSITIMDYDYCLFSHNKHYYPFKTLKEFKKLYNEHMYHYYDLGLRHFILD